MFQLFELSCCCHGFVLESKLSAQTMTSSLVALQLKTSSEAKTLKNSCSQSIPSVGLFESHAGNNSVPLWELAIPKAGTTSSAPAGVRGLRGREGQPLGRADYRCGRRVCRLGSCERRDDARWRLAAQQADCSVPHSGR